MDSPLVFSTGHLWNCKVLQRLRISILQKGEDYAFFISRTYTVKPSKPLPSIPPLGELHLFILGGTPNSIEIVYNS